MYSLRLKILAITFVFMTLLGAAFVAYSMVTTAKYKQLRIESIGKTVALETEKINKLIGMVERGAISLSRDGLLYCESRSNEVAETSAMVFLHSFPVAVGAGFWFEPYAYDKNTIRAGIYAFFDKEKGEVRLDDTFIMAEYDYHNQNWYREVFDAIKKPYQVVWAKPYVDDTGSFSYMTTAGAGVFDQDDNLIGISTVDWEIEKVIAELSAMKPTENSFILLYAPEHDYIITDTYEPKHFRQNISDAPLDTIPWDTEAGSFVFEGIRYLSFSRTLDNNWLLNMEIPENEIFADVEKNNARFSVIMVVSSVIMLCLAFVVNTKLIKAHTRERTEKERISTELNIAAEIQTMMLPSEFPPFPDKAEFDIHASMLPAKEVGGDFYDFFFMDDDTLAVVIADVSGKGVPAALFMAIAKTLIKNTARSGKAPGEVFAIVNNILCENNEKGMFVTAFMGYYSIKSGSFVFVNAGHNPPLLKKAGSDYAFIKAKPGFILGVMEDFMYNEESIDLEPGDTLYLYTDGVTEAMNNDMALFSEERLLAVLNNNKDTPVEELLSAIKQEIDSFTGGAAQADDITMLALHVNGSETTDSMKMITVEARIESLHTIIDFVDTELSRHDVAPPLKNQLDAAVEEVFSNIVNYAYKPGTGNATIGINVGEEIMFRFEDSGNPFNPTEIPDPDFNKPLAEREIGGLGVFIVKQFMDKVYYSRFENKNILVMTKKNI